ncbi:AimR family lysis-lysogeny pheromone receptor (plasmid) [Bacillus carboniphilus]|uniref:AimR family lysis-lysogeny pheromone receptor n=1 Tax=Bacillus carboniphilus TaxID=86663 RepID=A0ABY9K0G9_9BACI|nr:AimR family lysis-lysogeny pheromone receptor [Bacillus carboniphilus]WLR44504.1 AimR family lysis-lysogeny pheromone receptor [Bacillus carboniphilus]
MELKEIANLIERNASNKVRSYRQLGKEVGVRHGTILNFIKFARKEEGGTEPSVELVCNLHYAHEGSAEDILSTITDFVHYGLKEERLKEVIDFCYEFALFPLLYDLIDEGKESQSHRMAKFCEAYNVLADGRRHITTWKETNSRAQKIRSSDKLVQYIVSYIEILYFHNEIGSSTKVDVNETFESIIRRTKKLIVDINSSPKNYITKKLIFKLNEGLMRIYVKKENHNEAREIAYTFINNSCGSRFKAAAYFSLGMSYFNSDIKMSLRYLNISAEMYKENDFLKEYTDVRFYIELLWIISGYKDIECIHGVNKAFMLCSQGRYEESLNGLEGINLYGYDEMVAKMIKGIIEESHVKKKDYFDDVRNFFLRLGDRNLAKLPDTVFEKFCNSVLINQ